MADDSQYGGSLLDHVDESATVADTSMFDSPADIPDYPTLDVFGHFEILGRLARGGMAEIFLAREPGYGGLKRHVVLKRVLPEYEAREEFRNMFLEEARMATRLYHQNVCHVYECGNFDGRTFMTLEWVYGITLRKLIRRAGHAVPPLLTAHIIANVASALDYVHNATGVDGKPLNIIHRDVTPHNVMLGWDGRIKLLDFGIAKTSTNLEAEKNIQGKFANLSPEQAMGKPFDNRCDIFSLGICLYEALTGRPLYHRDSPPATMRAIVEEATPSVRDVKPDCPPELDAIVRKALQKRPQDRYRTAGAMQRALEQYIAAQGALVDAPQVASFLDRTFDESEKVPLKAKSAKLTGTFTSLTGSAATGSFGPFGTDGAPPGRPDSLPPPAVVPRSHQKQRQQQTMILVGGAILLAVVGLAAGGLLVWALGLAG